MNLTIGRVYLLRGGHLRRYQGLYAGRDGKPKGPCLAFRGVRDDHDPSCPVGSSHDPSEVLREVTEADRPWLLERREQAAARNLQDTADDVTKILTELG